MSKRRILHMLAPDKNVSAFDVNMAVDAGYEVIVPYAGIETAEVIDLVQDAIFSRSPGSAKYTGVFIGGWDVNVAADMLERARKGTVPPFEISVFADPNGAYTTSAAMIALTERTLRERTGDGLQGRQLKVFGGGPVGLCAGVLAARQGAEVTLVRLTQRAGSDAVQRFCARYDVALNSVEGHDSNARARALSDADVVLCTAKAGIQVIDAELLGVATSLKLAADVNAVPPSGIEGVAAHSDGDALACGAGTAAALGALAIGKLKYGVQRGMFERMLASESALCLDFLDAYALAAHSD